MNRSGKRTVCGIVSVLNADASVVERTLLPNRFYDAEAFVFQQKSAPSRIMRAREGHGIREVGHVPDWIRRSMKWYDDHFGQPQ